MATFKRSDGETMHEFHDAQVIRRGGLDMQVCVPKDWDDATVKQFADRENPCGTENGWHIRKDGDKALGGNAGRVNCSLRDEYVHIVLGA